MYRAIIKHLFGVLIYGLNCNTYPHEHLLPIINYMYSVMQLVSTMHFASTCSPRTTFSICKSAMVQMAQHTFIFWLTRNKPSAFFSLSFLPRIFRIESVLFAAAAVVVRTVDAIHAKRWKWALIFGIVIHACIENGLINERNDAGSFIRCFFSRIFHFFSSLFNEYGAYVVIASLLCGAFFLSLYLYFLLVFNSAVRAVFFFFSFFFKMDDVRVRTHTTNDRKRYKFQVWIKCSCKKLAHKRTNKRTNEQKNEAVAAASALEQS